MSNTPFTAKGQQRRAEIVSAASDMLQESGPSSVTMRQVAARVGCSLSAMTYYFDNADQLLSEAGSRNIATWATRAELIADQAEKSPPPMSRDEAIRLLLRATLPESEPLLGHYQQLVAAGQSEPVSAAYQAGRDRLNSAVGRVLGVIGAPIPPALAIAVVDGAAVAALSEGRDVRETAFERMGDLFSVITR